MRGLIHTLNRYKFTINENTPIEEEIALDPELLGKVFENLLAAYNPETGTTARKQTGSFYTPREIVNYMVDESLLAYLETQLAGAADAEARLRHLFAYNEEPHQFSAAEVSKLVVAIDNVKILDPACGSGAFPMGILHKLVFILGKLDPRNERWKERQIAPIRQAIADTANIPDSKLRRQVTEELEQKIEETEAAFARNELDYGRKLYLIENCIYGVDIQPIAVQIAKLRFFISLVVDQRIDDAADNRGILPLPNLETKFVAANTLLGLDKPAQMSLRNPAITAKERELAEVRRRHFVARTPRTKLKYREQDAQLRQEIGDLLRKDGFPNTTTRQLANWDPYDQNAHADFFDPEWMFGIDNGFDIAIGNPPYIKEYTYREAFNGLRDSPYYQGKMDIWYFFACACLDIVKRDTGVLTFIATNNWVTNHGASILRRQIAKSARLVQFLDFGDYKIFESAGIQTMVLIAKRINSPEKYQFDYRRLTSKDSDFTDVLQLLAGNANPYCEYLMPVFDRRRLSKGVFVFADGEIEEVLRKLTTMANFEFTQGEIATGIDVHQDFVNKKSAQILGGPGEDR